MIDTALLLVLMAGWGGLLEIQRLPWIENETALLVADFDQDGRGEVALLHRGRLDLYGRDRRSPSFSTALPEGTAVLDVADLDQDGTVDILAIAGNGVFRIPVVEDGGETAPVLCFSRESQYSHYTGPPFPAVLVIEREETVFVALPRRGQLELLTIDGEVADTFPTGPDAPNHLELGQPFHVHANQHAQSGPPDALEFRVSSIAAYKPLFPEIDLPVAIADPPRRPGTARQQREVEALDPQRWPWFSVGAAGNDQVRALYAQTGAPGGQTVIRIRRVPEKPRPSTTDLMGPPRHYPGLLLRHPDRVPDFNGDGLNDLLLWKPERIVPTVDNLARAAARGTWPIRVAAYAYGRTDRRFGSRPLLQIQLEVPLNRYLESGGGTPLDPIFPYDINGDGRSDFGCLVSPRSVAFWVSGDGGFSEEPAFTHTFPEEIREVVLEADLEGQGKTTIALRGASGLYLLRPDTTFAR